MKTLIKSATVLIMFLPLVSISQNNIKSANPGSETKSQEYIADRSAGSVSLIQGNVGGGGYFFAGFAGQLGMFLNEDWVPGYIVLNDGVSLDQIMLRYDIYHQQMQFVNKDDTLAISNPDEIEYILMDGRKFIFTVFNNDGAVQKGYFEVLTEGECKLLLRRFVKYHYLTSSDNDKHKDEYSGVSQYFVQKKEDRVARQIVPGRKSILCVFNDEEKKVREFIKVNNLKIKSADDLVQIVNFYNSLK
jgi:hypothetical protein